MSDDDLHGRIEALAHEEHTLLLSQPGGGLTAVQHARLRELETQLDRTWDLLRQRDARRRAGLDVSGAKLRSADEVEGYRQ